MNEQTAVPVYEPPALVALGEFTQETLGGDPHGIDDHSGYFI